MIFFEAIVTYIQLQAAAAEVEKSWSERKSPQRPM